MAAFEAISRLRILPDDSGSLLDIRSARLPLIPGDSDYDPRDHREPKAPISPWMAHFNLIRTMLGPGLLGMPVAVSASGLVVGTIFTFTSGILLIHTYSLLLNNLTEISKQLKIPYISYRYGFRAAVLHGPPVFRFIGNRGPTIIGLFMIISQVGISTVCVILTSDSLRDVVDWDSNNTALLALMPCYLLLECFMKNLKRVTYIGLFGNFLNLSGLALLFYHIFKEPQKDVIYVEQDVGGWLFSSGMCLFNLSALAVILSLDKALKKPQIMTKKFGVITIGLGIPTVISATVGALGYWAFGTMEENILRSLPFEDTTSIIIMIFYIISVTLAYPLHCYPIMGIIEEMCRYGDEDYAPSQETMEIIKIICRPFFVLLAFFIAYKCPYQGPFIAFVGNLCTGVLSVVFPVIMDICVRYGVPGAYGRWHIHLIKDVIIFVLGLLTFVFGVYFCGYLIYIRSISTSSESVRDEFF